MTVLFTSSRPLGRCENLTAVWDAYVGDKEFALIRPNGDCPEADGGYPVIVTDEFLKSAGEPPAKVVMIGHGLYGDKKYGLDQKVRYYTPGQTALVSWLVTSSEYTRRFGASCAGIPIDRCLALGTPRTDAYVGKRKGDGGTFLAGYERAYLFAPTIRAGWEPPAPRIDWGEVDRALRDGEVLAVKRHMVTRAPLLDRGYARIVEVDPMEPSAPYLIDCDAVITDYSSIMFDGYLLGKPCVLFCPDQDEYLAARGMYMEYHEDYSSYACWTPQEAVNMARIAAGLGMQGNELQCLDMCASACDGHSTERVIDLIRSLL